MVPVFRIVIMVLGGYLVFRYLDQDGSLNCLMSEFRAVPKFGGTLERDPYHNPNHDIDTRFMAI